MTDAGRDFPFAPSGEPEQRRGDDDDAVTTRAALLRQFSLQRMTGYGMELGDALSLRRLVEEGFDWGSTARQLAKRAFRLAEWAEKSADDVGRRAGLCRASANLRIAQVIDEVDSAERVETYNSGELAFQASVADDKRFERMTVPHPTGDLVCWLVRSPAGASQPLVVLIGGIEGWALDLVGYAAALGEYGIATLLVDGPGQGQTRFAHGHYLGEDSPARIREIVHFARDCVADGAPVGVWGNSFGGNLVLHAASGNDDVGACCNNGGPPSPIKLSERPRFFNKMRAMCGPATPEDAAAVFTSLELDSAALELRCPFLLVHGGADPLITVEESQWILDRVASSEKDMILFPDGDHCIYNRPGDRFAAVGNFFARTLG